MEARRWVLLVLAAGIVAGVGCSKKKDDGTTTETEADGDKLPFVMEAAVQSVGGEAGAADGSTMSPLSIEPRAACDYSNVRSTCSGTVRTVNWNGCTVTTGGGVSLTMSGIITEDYESYGAATCQLSQDPAYVTRVISSSSPRVITFPSGAKLTSTMEPGTAWDGTTFPSAAQGTKISRIESGTSNGVSCGTGSNSCFRIEVRGLKNTFTGPLGRKWYEHLVTSDVTYKGSKTTSNRVMSGTVTLWHQLNERKAVSTLTNVSWTDANCCYPTSGSVTTVFTGSISATHTLTFGATCGQATWTDSSGSSSYTLSQCTP